MYGINATAGGYNTAFGCRTVTVNNRVPTGFIDSVTTTANSITATGWALDPDTTNPITIQLDVDGSSTTFTADGSRPDIAAAFGKGDRHGYIATLAATAGSHQVCI